MALELCAHVPATTEDLLRAVLGDETGKWALVGAYADPAQCDKAVRARHDDTSRSFRAAARVPRTDTPQTPVTPQKVVSYTKS
jgi:hypothetical protein